MLKEEAVKPKWMVDCEAAVESSLSSGENIINIKWEVLSGIVYSELAQIQPRNRAKRLRVYADLFSRKSAANPTLMSDYFIFEHFVTLSFKPSGLFTLNLDTLWPEWETDKKRAHYEAFILKLLEHRFHWYLIYFYDKEIELPEIKRLGRELLALNRLTEASSPPHTSTYTSPSVNVFKIFFNWLKQIFIKLFNEKTLSYLKINAPIFEEIWSIFKRLNLMPSLLTDTACHKVLKDYTEVGKGVDIGENLVLRSNHFSKLHVNSIKALSEGFAKDKQQFIQWGQHRFRSALLAYVHNPSRGLTELLNIFKETQSVIKGYSQMLYHCREEADARWQKSGSYIKKIDKLDGVLLGIDEELREVQRGWLEDIRSASKEDAQFQKACDCFEVLLSEEMRAFDDICWPALTCYCKMRSEEKLEAEMQARDILHQKQKHGSRLKRSYYNTRVVFTQTDFALAEDRSPKESDLRKKMLAIHPDHVLRNFAALKDIAEYCSTEVEKQRSRYKDVSFMWYASAWYAAAPAHAESKENRLTTLFSHMDLTVEPPIVIEEAPILDLSVVRLHQAYLRWVETQPSIEKAVEDGHFPGPYYPQHHLYEKGDDELEIASHIVFRQQCLGMKKRLAEIPAELQSCAAKTAVLEKEKAQVEAEKAQAEAKTLQVEAEKAQVEAEKAQVEAEKAQVEAEKAQVEAEAQRSRAKLANSYKAKLVKVLIKALPSLLNATEPRVLLGAIRDRFAEEKEEARSYIGNLMKEVIGGNGELKALASYLQSNSGVSEIGIFTPPRVASPSVEESETHDESEEDARKPLLRPGA